MQVDQAAVVEQRLPVADVARVRRLFPRQQVVQFGVAADAPVESLEPVLDSCELRMPPGRCHAVMSKGVRPATEVFLQPLPRPVGRLGIALGPEAVQPVRHGIVGHPVEQRERVGRHDPGKIVPVHLASHRRQVRDAVPVGESGLERVTERVQGARALKLQPADVAVRCDRAVEHDECAVVPTMRAKIASLDQQRIRFRIRPPQEQMQHRALVATQLPVAFRHQNAKRKRPRRREARIGRDRLVEMSPCSLDVRLAFDDPRRQGHRHVLLAQRKERARDEKIGPRPVAMGRTDRVQTDQRKFDEPTVAAQFRLAHLKEGEANVGSRTSATMGASGVFRERGCAGYVSD